MLSVVPMYGYTPNKLGWPSSVYVVTPSDTENDNYIVGIQYIASNNVQCGFLATVFFLNFTSIYIYNNY